MSKSNVVTLRPAEAGALGGKRRAERLSPEERKSAASTAARARWSTENEEIPRATHGSPDHPLRIGDMEIPCYVLADGRRVLQQGGVIGALNMSHGGSYSRGGDRLAKFAAQGRLKDFVSNELLDRTADPIRFRTTRNTLAYGYEATILHDLCEAILAARLDGRLQKQQTHIADRAEILVRGFARVGIIALVDEATGYQEVRDRQALQAILDQFLRKTLAAWAKRFPDEFYYHIARLRGWEWKGRKFNPPQIVAYYTNDFVYHRLAPNLVEELDKRN